MQRLAEFEPDDTRPEDGDRSGQVLELEDSSLSISRSPSASKGGGTFGRDPVAMTIRSAVTRRPSSSSSSRSDRNFARAQTRCSTGQALDCTHHEADEAVAFVADALHDRAPVDPRPVVVDAELRRALAPARRLGGRDQQLGGHAADTGAGRAIRSALDQKHALRDLHDLAIGAHAGGAGSDDRHLCP